MKNKSNNKRRSNLFKRVVCLVLSAAIFISDSYILTVLDDIGINLLPVVYAEETRNISTISELVQYSKEYDATHAKDTLNISIASNGEGTYQTSDTQYSYDEFISIGSSSSNAFEGTVNITVLASSYFNFTKPLFGYIKDSAQVTVSGGSSSGYLELRRPMTSNLMPIFAENVIHDTDTTKYDPADESQYTNWRIRINYFHEEGEASVVTNFPSVIGRIDDNSKLSLDILNDAQYTNNGEEYKADIQATASGVNAGLICGTLGENAEIKVSVGGSNTNFSVTSASGNAGGLIGEMESGSRVILDGSNITGGSNRTITASNGYAGGLVGKATNASIVFDNGFNVNEHINGKNGAGSIAGYYISGSGTTFDLDKAQISCTLTSANAGGLFGVFETSGDFSLVGAKDSETNEDSYLISTTVAGQPNNAVYGGLIGLYKTSALTNTLTIGEISLTTNGTGNSGGLIGKIDDTNPAYILVNGASVTNTISGSFCGIVNNAGNVGHFLNISGFTLSGPSASGLVGTMNCGVIRLSGTTDLSRTASSSAQLVNKRGNTLIYAVGDGSTAGGWIFKRGTVAAIDDIGNWGEVVRVASDGSGDVLEFDSSAHTVTVASSTTSISTQAQFIATALNMQINQGDRGALQFTQDSSDATKTVSDTLLSSSTTISITGTINLAGTGIMGLMRDDGKKTTFSGNTATDSDVAFSGIINGGGTVNLAIGEPYGIRGTSALTTNDDGNGRLHGHAKVGLLSVTNRASISSLTVGGTIDTNSSIGMYLGGFVGQSKGSLTMSSVTNTVRIDGIFSSDKSQYVGGMIGEVEGDGSAISISGTNKSIISLNGHNTTYASNGIGFVADNTVTISFSSYTLGNTSSINTASLSNSAGADYARCGGMIGFINGSSKNKTVNLNDVSITYYNLELSASECAGGVLGYKWDNTEVNIGNTGTTGIVVSHGDIDQTTVSSAGLVHTATGHWAVSKLKIDNTDFALTNTTNYGILVNKGDGLFMEIKSPSGSNNGFDLSTGNSVTNTGSTLTVYDELVAYSASVDDSGNSNVINNGNGVVSIHTASGMVVGGKYANQISISDTLKNNPYTRYYYDLDVIRTAVTSDTYPSGSTAAEQNAYKLMMWNLRQYAVSGIQSYFTSSNNATEPLTGNFDLSKVSYYPINRSSAISIGEAGFTFNNKNIEDSAVAGTTCRSTISTDSQHYLMHTGLFLNVSGNISITDDITLSGSIGKHDSGSGAIVTGNFGGLTEGTTTFSNSEGKLITLNGLTVNATDGAVGSRTYKPVLINKVGSHVSLTMNGVKTEADSYKDGTGVKMAGSSLIGTVGTKDSDGKATSESINLTFNDIRLDARTDSNKSDTNLSALSSLYGTTQGVFTKATLLDEFIYNNNTDCKGVYNYRLDEDWNSSTKAAIHNVTYGYEINGTTEYTNQQNHYVDLLGKTNPESYDNTQSDTISYDFQYFLPYVAIRSYVEGTVTSRSRELMVNHTNVSITKGCGTYNDPYIIEENGQIEAIAKILELGTVSDGFTIKVPNITSKSGSGSSATFTYKTWCDSDDLLLTYGSGSYVASNTNYNHTTQQLAKYLAGAYYKITKVSKTTVEGESTVTTYSSVNINSTSFNGLGGTANEYAFHGVIVGDSDTATYPLVNNTGAPLIRTSYGSVVKNLKINVRNTNITRTQSDVSQKFIVGGGCSNYGAVIGQILGGDNIIDTVTVDYTGSTINLDGTTPKIIPVGGYVGVVASGALIFRGTNSANLSGIVKNNNTAISMADTDWLYVNPIIGRVLNGYAVYETTTNNSSNDYKYSESTVTMQNGTKNYSIADIDPDLSKVEVSAYTQKGTTVYYMTDVTVPNAQSMYILSLLMQSRTIGNNKYGTALKVLDSDSYDSTKKQAMHHAKYDKVGTNDSSDYSSYAIYDSVGLANVSGIKYAPYLVERYTSAVGGYYYILSLTNNKTVCNMTLTGSDNDWYLPDGFKGVGYIGYDKSTSDGISLHKFDGNEKTIHLNMSLNHYSDSTDNYCPSSGNVGFGLFSSIKHNSQAQGGAVTADNLETDDYKIKNLNLTGTIDYNVADVTEYSSSNVYKDKYIDVGGFAGYCGYSEANDLRIEGIDLSGLTINGFKTAGGLFGYLKMAASNVYLAKISNITASNGTLTVTSKDYVGGIVGRCEQIGLTIDSLTLDNLSIVSYFYETGTITYNNGAGGIIGWAANASTNQPITLSNITVGSSTGTSNLRIGYPNEAPYTNTNNADNYYQIAVGGLVGRSMTNKNSSYDYSMIIEHCNVYNVDFYGHRVAGIIGHDAAGSGKTASGTYLLMSDVHVVSSNSASINGIKKLLNLGDRGCGGLVGVMWNDKNKDFIDCSVEGYTLRSYNDTGGISSNMQTGGTVTIKNFKATDLNIYSNYHGSLFGYLKCNTNGYNILLDNIQFNNYVDEEGVVHKHSNGYIEKKYGYLVGYNGGCVIKLVGLTRQHLENTLSDHLNRIVGAKNSDANYNYGSGGYIIFADTLGKCTATTTAGTKQSDLSDKTNVTAKSPWVTVSPSINISGTEAETTQVLTGDSIMSNFLAADTLSNYNNVDTAGIISSLADVSTTAKTNYDSFRDSQLFSTYEDEMGDGSLPEGVSNFAVIAVDNNATDLDTAINSYVQMLTHTTDNYARTNNNGSVYKVQIYRCVYNSTTNVFDKTVGSTGLTRDSSNGFHPYVEHPDTDEDTACFTLVDIQFLNPSNSNEVAYHVYVPVLIKKLLKFNFKASSLPGTVYDYTNYVYKTSSHTTEDKWGTPSVTNLGTPVTMYFRYDYTSNVSEWQEMINNGESLMWHTNNKLQLKTAASNLPSNTRMVLVDANNNDRAYFAKASDTGVFTKNTNSDQNDYFIDLTKFKNGSDEFAAKNFGERLPITASTTSSTAATKAYVISASGESVYVTATIGSGTTRSNFRPATDAEISDASKTKYYLTVGGTTSSPPAGLSENYYITFFTDTANDPLRVIIGGSAPSLSSSPQNSEISKHTLKCTNQTESALILGNIFKQEFTKFETENAQSGLVNNSCDYFEADITVKISVNNDNDEAETIIRYLNNDSIEVYHSILLGLTKNDGTTVENTIYGTPTYTVNTAKEASGIYGTISSTFSDSAVDISGFSIPSPNNTSSFIQIGDLDYNIKPLLVEKIGSTYGGAIISVNGLRVHFDYLNIPNQFPYQPSTVEGQNTVGTTVKAYSTLDSDYTNIAYSSIREEMADSNAVKYHSETPSSATLVYVVDTSDDIDIVKNYNMLGINPIDEAEYFNNIITADGTYNAVSFVDSAQAGKIRWTLSLEKKNESGAYETVKMSDYVSGNVTVGNRTSGAVFTASGNTFIYDEDYTTPMDITKLTTIYAMKTGDDLEALVDGDGNPVTGVYANYKVTLSATLYTGSEALSGDLSSRKIDNSTVSDYIKYTNAKVKSSWVNPSN